MASTTYRFRSSAHGSDTRAARCGRPYPFLLWFAATSAIAILLMLLTVASFLTRFVERAGLDHDASVMDQLINSIVAVEAAAGYFEGDEQADKGDFIEFLAHLGALPGVLRANVYSLQHEVLWSSDPRLIGQRFADNDELERAFAGGIVINTGIVGRADKAEHTKLGTPGDRFVENYLPIWGDRGRDDWPIGVIEIYRTPSDLWRTIETSQQRVWWGGIGVALLLYVMLYLIAARAARVIARQQAALVKAERLAIAGEMASAVAHGLRNPLASIRSTAELGLESEPEPEMRELLDEVVIQADRLEGWIRQFLATARDDPTGLDAADLRATLQACLGILRPQLLRRGMSVNVQIPAVVPRVRCHPVILQQALNSVLANAAEAMADGGRLRVEVWAEDGHAYVAIVDSGPGMTAVEIEAALSPFATTKPAGLGLGLPLARETLERQGGQLLITSRPGHGTTVTLVLPAVPADAAQGDIA